ncbi:MAG: hypothetical protein J5720_01675 [Bacteroidaceae bacterium]|nr:hypothetical protein [Bacteroidaceae bacterium]
MSYQIIKYTDYFIYGIMLLMSVLLVSCTTDDPAELIETEINNNTNSEDNCTTNYNNNDNDNTTNLDSVEKKNLLRNGGLEDWNTITRYDILNYWLCHNNFNVTRNYKVVFEGKYSAKMQSTQTGSTATVDQCIPVEPSSRIRIRFHYYVEQWKDKGARTYCYFRTQSAEVSTISADELKALYDKNTYYIIRGGGYGLAYLPHNLSVWQVFDETIQVPPTATYFVFGVNSYYGTTMYVDDCWVLDETE